MRPDEITRLERLFSRSIDALVAVRAAVALGKLPSEAQITEACRATDETFEELANFPNVRYRTGGRQHV